MENVTAQEMMMVPVTAAVSSEPQESWEAMSVIYLMSLSALNSIFNLVKRKDLNMQKVAQ